jgi:hypothetical protein
VRRNRKDRCKGGFCYNCAKCRAWREHWPFYTITSESHERVNVKTVITRVIIWEGVERVTTKTFLAMSRTRPARTTSDKRLRWQEKRTNG